MSYPNFLIIGAMKSGTTSLYHYLNQHPEIYLSPQKEPHFFAYKDERIKFKGPGDQERIEKMVVSDEQQYLRLFEGIKNEKAVGEASAMYLYYSEAAKNIKEVIPDVKLIVMLRNPVDRAYSSYKHLVRDDREFLDSFEEALEAEEKRISEEWLPLWHYVEAGKYGKQLTSYFEIFNKEQIKVILFEDFKKETSKVVKSTFEFLGVNKGFTPKLDIQYNVSGIPKFQILHNYLRRESKLRKVLGCFISEKNRDLIRNKILNFNIGSSPKLKPETRIKLENFFKDDFQKLKELIAIEEKRWFKNVE